MPLPYRILVYLENSFVVVTEVERLDRPDERDPSRRFSWLLFYKESAALRPLDFVSQDAQPDAEERTFGQGRLRYTAQGGVYQSYGTGQTSQLRVGSPAVLPAALADALEAYWQEQE